MQSGVKLFNSNKVYASPPYKLSFTKVGTVWQLIHQINDREGLTGMYLVAGANSVPEKHDDGMKMLLRDIRKLKPFAKDQEIKAVLDSRKLDQGQALWLMNKGGRLVLSDQGPPENPEGKTHKLYSVFSIANKTFNAPGDAGYSDSPFSWTDNGRPFDPSVDNMMDLENAHADRAAGATEAILIQRGTGQNCLGQAVFAQYAFPCSLDCPN